MFRVFSMISLLFLHSNKKSKHVVFVNYAHIWP
nr:MAG TPA: hypothetical protein [Caudoviricetes sp.]